MLLLLSCSFMSDSLQPHGLHHSRLPYPSPPPGVCLNSCPVMPSNRLVLCHPLLLLSSVFPSIRVFSNGLALRIRWPKYWSFSFSISPLNEYSEFISFRIEWVDLLAVQGTLNSLQKHQFSVIYPSLRSSYHIHTWLLEKPYLWLDGLLLAK